MKGHIVIRTGTQLRAFALNKAAPTMIGAAPDADLRIAEPGMEPMHAQLVWEPRAGTWLLLPGTANAKRTLLLNGHAVSAPQELGDGSLVEMPGLLLRFGLTPDAPKFGGKPVREVPLRGRMKLVYGRAGGDPLPVPKVELDPEDTRLSRQHLEIEQAKPGVVVATDRSQTGTLLNGQRFDRRALVVGDRLRLGRYCFEFTGSSLRSVSSSGGAKIEARHLTVTVKHGRNILEDVSLDIPACSFTGILGGSGQGKSTLMNALCGVNPAETSGEVYINAARLDDALQMAEVGIGYVPQDDIVHRELTVTEAITCSARLKLPSSTPSRAIADLVTETIDRLGLTEHRDKRISQLSGGQRKRVSIATELLAKPSVLFLDEPSSGLDPKIEFDLMSLLRRLAADCTVVCTTHVLGRAYLFDQLCFVHGGHLIFSGTPEEAQKWFGAENGLEEIYLKMGADGTRTAADWRKEFEQSIAQAKPLAYLASAEAEEDHRTKMGAGFLRTLRVLWRRQWKVLGADRLNLLFLLAQPLAIGLLIGWVAEDAVLRMFLCVVATLWFGCSNGAQQIVRELPIFKRERVCGLGLNAYVLSKYKFLSLLTILQALLLLVMTLGCAHKIHPSSFKAPAFYAEMMKRIIPPEARSGNPAKDAHDPIEFDVVTQGIQDSLNKPAKSAASALSASTKPHLITRIMLPLAVFFECGQNLLDSTDPGEGKPPAADTETSALRIFAMALGLKLAALLAAAIVGVATGLVISAMVRTETQAVMWVPLLLIPQILFGGFVVTRPEMSTGVRVAAQIVPSFCAQTMMDTGNIYGQATPRMTNRTRYPIFLTPEAEQDEVRWTEAGKLLTEDYDKVSAWNKSWQNLAVLPDLAGQHLNVSRMIHGVKKYDDTTDRRRDVRYPMGAIFHDTGTTTASLLILSYWLAACYGITLLSLAGKRGGV